MPKSANSIDCRCGGHYVKKNRSKHMETNKHQSYIQNLDFIDWEDMDFGTERSSYCGICGKREPGYFSSKGELQGDIICHDCDLVWVYDENVGRDYGGYSKRRNDEDQYNQPCSNHGCGTILTEDTHIFCLSKEGEEDQQWCYECFYDCGMDAREEGWTFDEEGEQILDEEEEAEKVEKEKVEKEKVEKEKVKKEKEVDCDYCNRIMGRALGSIAREHCQSCDGYEEEY